MFRLRTSRLLKTILRLSYLFTDVTYYKGISTVGGGCVPTVLEFLTTNRNKTPTSLRSPNINLEKGGQNDMYGVTTHFYMLSDFYKI